MLSLLVSGIAMATFMLPVHPKPRPIRIALVSDTHISHNESETQAGYRKHLAIVIAQVNAAKPDLILLGGDLTDDGEAESFESFLQVREGFRAPVRWVPGNHDCGGKLSAGAAGAVTEASLAKYEDAMGRSFGAETLRGVRLVRINGSLLGSGLKAEARQWAMLEREAAKPCAEPRVVLLHYPMFLEKPSETEGGYWTVDPAPRARLIALVTRMRARAVFSGHLHRRLYTSLDGAPCITAPATSFGLPAGKEPPAWMLVTIADGQVQVEWKQIPVVAEP